jgi:hypothetical protein
MSAELQAVVVGNCITLTGPGGSVRLTAEQLGSLAETAISLADLIGPDPDLEPNGDERDGTAAEDDFCAFVGHLGPGCPLADPGGTVVGA